MNSRTIRDEGEATMRKLLLSSLLALTLVMPASAKQAAKVTEPLPADLIGAVTVVDTTVTIDEKAKANADKLDDIAAQKRVAAKLPPIDGSAPLPPRPAATEYSTLPLTQMLPLEVEDVTKAWHLTSGRPVRLAITITAVKTADVGMAMLLGSADTLDGMVDVVDPVSGAKLGKFRALVYNYRAGMLGLAVRGTGVREKLAEAFADEISRQLSGQKHRPKA